MKIIFIVSIFGFLFFDAYAAGEKAVNAGYFYDASVQKYFTDGKSAFSVQAVENSNYLEKIEISVNDGDFSSYNGKLNLTNEGLHTIRFRAVDPVSNWSPIQVFRIYVDLSAPMTKFGWKGENFVSGNLTYINAQTKLQTTAEDSLAGVSKTMYQSEGDIKALRGDLAFAKEGPQKIMIASVDRVGNNEAWKDINFFVDTRAPKSEALVQGTSFRKGDHLFINYGSQITLTSQDEGSGLQKIEYQINNGTIVPYGQSIPLADALVVLKFRGVDMVGNVEPWRTLTVNQDSQPPRVTIKEVGRAVHISGKTFARPGFKIDVSAIDTESGMKTTLISRGDKGGFEPLANNLISFDQPGQYEVKIRAIDSVGNVSEANPVSVIIDNASPVSEFHFTEKTAQKDGFVLTSLPNRLEIRSQDDGVGLDHIEISYDGKRFVGLTDIVDLSTWKEGQRTVYYRAVDRLGNTEEVKQVPVRVLTRGPIVDLFVESESLPNVPLSVLMKKGGKIPEKDREPTAKPTPQKE